MHYYKRNLGDYAKKAGRLSMLQHGSYTLLIDACYDREQFPTLDEAIEWTWASTTEEIEAVKFVLSKFFKLENDVYVQKRIQEEISEYHDKALKNQRIAQEREDKKREALTKRDENNTNREQDVHEQAPNHKPITNNHKPITKIKDKELMPDGKQSKKTKSRKISIPENFGISDRVKKWASEKGHTRLEERLEHFIGKSKSNGYVYVDWDEAFMCAIRDDWAKLPTTVVVDFKRQAL